MKKLQCVDSADHTKLVPYAEPSEWRIEIRRTPSELFTVYFDCDAEDSADAEAQAKAAFPTCEIIPKIKAPTARAFGAALRKKLKELGLTNTVKVETTSFAGFGFGSGCTASVDCPTPLPDETKAKLREIESAFRETPGGPQFSGNVPSSFMLKFRGAAYPFS